MFVKTVEEVIQSLKSLDPKEKIAFDLFSLDSAKETLEGKFDFIDQDFTDEDKKEMADEVIDQLDTGDISDRDLIDMVAERVAKEWGNK